uniref:Uncharacterized protein n=1 Tax=Anguilla anguilla TaxID=7936 RepID=A0A0E9T0M9_ANGAN
MFRRFISACIKLSLSLGTSGHDFSVCQQN